MKLFFFALISLLFTSYSIAQLASEPSSPPSNLQKGSTDLPYTFTLTFDGSGADGYLILRSTNPISATPTDGIAYSKGEGLGDAKVFGFGASSFVPIKEVLEYTEYYFKVFAYNINGSDESSINYLESNPLEGTIRSMGANPFGYYNGIDFSSNNLINELGNLLKDHDIVAYGDFRNTIIDNFFERDTANGQKVVNCQYSNEFKIYPPTFNFVRENYNREHRMPFSWIDFGNQSREDFENEPEGTDYHSLELVQSDVNQQRLNYPFSNDIVSNVYTYEEFIQGRDSDNKDVAQVMASRRGDVARSLFYTMICYNDKYGQNWGLNNLLSRSENQDLQQLIDWHNEDPVDAFERTRNEYVYSLQNNRNPFIDFPNLVECIDFRDLSLKSSCEFVGIDEKSIAINELDIYPNPAQNSAQVNWKNAPSKNLTWKLTDLSGKTISKGLYNPAENNNLLLDLSALSSGYFIFTAENDREIHQGKLIVAP